MVMTERDGLRPLTAMVFRWRIHGKRRGYTLVELMLVVIVIGILSAIAVPAYQRYAERARRVEAKEMLLRIGHAQERYHATYHRFSYELINELRFAQAMTPSGFYRLELSRSPTAGEGQGFIATAVPVNGQSGDACGQLSVDHQGRRRPIRDDASRNRNGACW
jgi:type IV pilus assembly protein PilE